MTLAYAFNLTPIILGDYTDVDSVFTSFQRYHWNDEGTVDPDAVDREGVDIILAWYVYEDYSGSAYVLFRKDGKLYEVHGSHCSCYGLEGQWEPDETTVESIRHRLEKGDLGVGYSYYGDDEAPNRFAKELKELLAQHEGMIYEVG